MQYFNKKISNYIIIKEHSENVGFKIISEDSYTENSLKGYKIIFKQMGGQIDRNNKDNDLIFRTEKKVSNEVKNIINSYISSHHKKMGNEKYNMISFNPYTSHLYFKMSYIYLKSFVQIYKENSELLNKLDKNGSEEEEVD